VTTNPLRLRPAWLTRALFAPFGDVIETEGRPAGTINDGYAERIGDLAEIDAGGRRAQVSIYRAVPRTLPMRISVVERHPLSSQTFVCLDGRPFLVVVARPGERPAAADLHAFVTNGRQGVNYARGTWHHPLIAYGPPADFLVVDGNRPGDDLDEVFYGDEEILLEPPTP
jgi:ureidoglycolate lyase